MLPAAPPIDLPGEGSGAALKRQILRSTVSAALAAGLLFVPTVAASEVPVGTRHSAEIEALTARFAPLAAEKGRKLVIFDQDREVHALAALAAADPRDGLDGNSIGSFGKLREASSTGHAYATVVHGPSGRAECRIAPPDPDASFTTSLGRRLGVWDVNPKKLGVDFGAEDLRRYILYHEIAHCLDDGAFSVSDLEHAHRAEAVADAFAILATIREGAPSPFLRQMADLRAIYMREMALHFGAAVPGRRRSDAEIARMPHVIYWMEEVYRALAPYEASAPDLSDREMLAVANYAADQGRMSSKRLISIHRVLAGEEVEANGHVNRVVANAYARLGRPGWRGGRLETGSFRVADWESAFKEKLRSTGPRGRTPEAVIAAERDRLRLRMTASARSPDAVAIEAALRRINEISHQGYAGIVDPPLVVISGQPFPRDSVVAMPRPQSGPTSRAEARTYRPVETPVVVVAGQRMPEHMPEVRMRSSASAPTMIDRSTESYERTRPNPPRRW